VRTPARSVRFIALVFALGALIASLLYAQTGAETPAKAREIESATATPSPAAKSKSTKGKSGKKPKSTATPTPSATPRKTPTPSASPSAKAKSKRKAGSKKKSPTPKGAKKKKSSPSKKTPAAKKATSAEESETPEVRAALPAMSGTATPLPGSTVVTAQPMEEPAEVTIEKSGYEERPSFFARLFGLGRRRSSGGGYRYLTRSVRAAIDRAPVSRGRWQFIVVHNSGTRQGNAAAFDYYHRHVRRMRNGLAYHFVIGNGTSTGNGEIEVGDRWRRQINGGHVHSDYLNNIALGICLVGDFNREQPTRAQLDCCEELVRYLRQRCGKIDNHYAIVKPHREVNPPRWATDCPGDVFPYSWFRRF